MTDDLQPKIDKWWTGLTPKEREEWWSEGDYALWKGFSYLVEFVRIERPHKKRDVLVLRGYGYEVAMEDCTPAPCAQLWWKLEAWLGKALHGIVAPDGDMRLWKYTIRIRWEMPVKSGDYKICRDADRRQALLAACLAVQRGE